MNYLSTTRHRPAVAIASLLVLLLAIATLGTPTARAQAEPDLATSAILVAAIVGVVVLLVNAGNKAIDARRSDYLKAHPETDPHVADAIRRGMFMRGMTTDEVRASIGPPTKINRTVGAYGVTEQWVYRYSSRSPGDYLYFRNGVLDSWQVSR